MTDDRQDGLATLLAVLSDQEVLHQKVLANLLAGTDLGHTLGIWAGSTRPIVVSEPFRGLFDLALLPALDGPAELAIELKAFSELSRSQFDRQTQAAGTMPRAYILLGPAYFQWRRVRDVRVIGLPELANSVGAAAGTADEPLRSIAEAYGRLLETQAAVWTGPLVPGRAWSGLEYFRFYDEVALYWREGARIYSATNPAGPDWILNPWHWRGVDRPEWQTALFYWELVGARLRFKIEWRGDRGSAGPARDRYRDALFESAQRLGNEIHGTRGRIGTFMTAAESGVDMRQELIVDGKVDAARARALYQRSMETYEGALALLAGN